MNVFRRLVFAAVAAGSIAGSFVAVAHHFGTATVIARAEVYERAAGRQDGEATKSDVGSASSTTAVASAMPGMDHGSFVPEWQPSDGIERSLYTALADIMTAVAFSLLLVAAFELRGGPTGWRDGLVWGLAGFAAFTLVPGLGLPADLPGTASAPLFARQVWWASTAAATAGGLALLFLQRRPLLILAGVVLLVAPHLYGAPQPAAYRSAAPEALAHGFVVMATLTSFVFWAALGALSAYFHGLLGARSSATRLGDRRGATNYA